MVLRRRQVLLGLTGAVSAGLAGCTEELPMSGSESETAPEAESESDLTPGDTADGQSPGPSEPTETPVTDNDQELNFSRTGLETYVRRQVNEYRTSTDEEEFRWEPLIQKGCRNHSEAMASASVLGTRIDGVSASERIGEHMNCNPDVTLAVLSRVDSLEAAAERVIEEWKQDPEASEKITGSLSTRIGVGVATSEDGYAYVTAAYC